MCHCLNKLQAKHCNRVFKNTTHSTDVLGRDLLCGGGDSGRALGEEKERNGAPLPHTPREREQGRQENQDTEEHAVIGQSFISGAQLKCTPDVGR